MLFSLGPHHSHDSAVSCPEWDPVPASRHRPYSQRVVFVCSNSAGGCLKD